MSNLMRRQCFWGCLIWALAGLAASAQSLDSDGDGLPDAWESQGITVNGVFLDLPGMGADPLHKDIFVQVDYMIANDHTHQPKSESLTRAMACFAAAPVSNPDGRSGINLHVDAGANSPMDSKRLWGSLSRSKELPHAQFFGSRNPNGSFNFDALDEVKAVNLPAERVGVFRYCMYLHQLQGQGGTSGWARGIPSDDFVVSLGRWTAQEGTVLEQAGTFVHELGHTLGLRHGGPDHLNFKPNYFSVMNYLFQTRGMRVNGRDGLIDYSRSAPPPLDENNLNETLGVPGAPAGFGTRYVALRKGIQERIPVNFTDRPIDWNEDGIIEQSLEYDLNGNGRPDVLLSQNNWPAVFYTGGSIGTPSGPKKAEPEEVHEELDWSVDQLTETDLAVSVDSQGDVSVDPGSSAVLHFEVSNLGKDADTYALAVNSERGWPTTVSPSSLSLAAGASQTVEVRVSVPAGAPPGVRDEVELLARSGELVDTDVEEVTIAGLIPNGGGGAFEGGSTGCFVATAAYGSYLDPHVVTLRRFRDECLAPAAPGVVDFYYRHSPPLARAVAGNGLLRILSRAILTPIIYALEQPILALAGLLLAWWGIRRRRRAGCKATPAGKLHGSTPPPLL